MDCCGMAIVRLIHFFLSSCFCGTSQHRKRRRRRRRWHNDKWNCYVINVIINTLTRSYTREEQTIALFEASGRIGRRGFIYSQVFLNFVSLRISFRRAGRPLSRLSLTQFLYFSLSRHSIAPPTAEPAIMVITIGDTDLFSVYAVSCDCVSHSPHRATRWMHAIDKPWNRSQRIVSFQ